MAETVVDPGTMTEQQSSQPEANIQEGEGKDQTKEPDFCLESILVSLTRPSHSAAFSSFRMNTWREGLAHCLYRFRSKVVQYLTRDIQKL